ncbi:hypothetical protein A3J56_02875 [Candidatus Giovannonibacteria bacterium RIFCSPHIGHO2_02_FULL_46_20]|uniref:Uncharacterized protein n=1 Tax=Candidatus Giovannonibacteria bacterium RIFCSPHIGHO2_02_FULL_46_20 TaxID=1798338 RepID=A0A1F5WGA1_9BACT|nr:MAG: hypothetical protein A3J56_02875 [Candidatus Giovannonibacteria bacterium RIFCSPHIGHO2_02_FULL_46_20]
MEPTNTKEPVGTSLKFWAPIIISSLLVLSSFLVYSNFNLSAQASAPLESYDIPGIQNPKALYIRWNYAYVGTAKDDGASPEFFIFNISDPTNIVLAGSFNVEADINAIYEENDVAYLATSRDNKELIMLNVKNKSAPVEIGNYNTPSGNNALSVYAVADKVFLGTQNYLAGNEFYILHASSSAPVTFLGSYDVSSSVNDIDVNGDYAYLATLQGSREFLILNISNPSAITLKAPINVAGTTEANGVAYSNGKLYGVTNNNGSNPDFFIWEFSDTTPLRILGSYDIGTQNSDVYAYGDYMYVSTSNSAGNVYEINVADPSTPAVRLAYLAGAPVNGIAIKDSLAHIITNAVEYQIAFLGSNQEPMLQDINGDGLVTISCLGDSNTGQIPATTTLKSWCTILGEVTVSSTNGVWRTTSRAAAGADLMRYGMTQLAAALEDDKADAIVSAFGGWDMTFLTATSSSGQYTWSNIMNEYKRMQAAAQSYGAEFFVVLHTAVTTQDSFSIQLNNNTLDFHNRLLHTFPRALVIDFFSPVVRPDDYFDHVHLNQSGHNKAGQEAIHETYNYSSIAKRLIR